MINKNRKGLRVEKLCYDELKHYPYRWKTIRHRFLNIDCFGLYDVIVANSKHLRFIQVKSGYSGNKVKQEIKKCKLPKNCIKEVWEYHGKKKGWRKFIIK